MIWTRQAAVSSTATTLLCTLPPGPATAVLTNISTSYVAIHTASGATAATAAGGAVIPPGGVVTLPSYRTSDQVSLYAIGAAAGTVGTFVVTDG